MNRMIALVELLPLVLAVVLPPLGGAGAGWMWGPLSWAWAIVVWPGAVVGGGVVAWYLSVYVVERFGQPWAWLSFWVVLAAFVLGAWLAFAVR